MNDNLITPKAWGKLPKEQRKLWKEIWQFQTASGEWRTETNKKHKTFEEYSEAYPSIPTQQRFERHTKKKAALPELELINKMLTYAGKYEISIQFWGPCNTNVFISKDGVDLHDFGGLSPEEAIKQTVNYLDRITGYGK